MIDAFDRATQKPVRIGEVFLQDQLLQSGINLCHDSLCGINLFTDSSHLIESIGLLPKDSKTESPLQTNLIYLTGRALPFFKNADPLLRPQEKEYGGDIYTDYSLHNFGFSGIDSFGTVSHITYGIRAFNKIQEGILGLHAAVIYDKRANGCHLLTGPTGSGKSTLGQYLQDSSPARFQVLGDDWSEINIRANTVRVISPVLSPGTPTPKVPLFSSFKGKRYYELPQPDVLSTDYPVISMTELHPKLGLDQSAFLKKAMYPIPFLIADELSQLIIPELHQGNATGHIMQIIIHKLEQYRNMYEKVTNTLGLAPVVNDKIIGVPELTKIISNQINHHG